MANKGELNDMANLSVGKYPIRTCRSLHHCELCSKDITLGQRYRDGGYGRRLHVECAQPYETQMEHIDKRQEGD